MIGNGIFGVLLNNILLSGGATFFTMNYQGVVAKDEIKLTIDTFGMPVDLVVKRTS
jgi:hypothetical protein